MRRYSIRFLIFLSMLGLGISTTLLWRVTESRVLSPSVEQPESSVKFDISLPIDQQSFDEEHFVGFQGTGPSVVIYVPNDDEIYIGKEKVTLAEIPAILTYKINGRFPPRAVLIKAAGFVQYRTVVSIINRIREVSDKPIGFVQTRREQMTGVWGSGS